MQGKLSLSLLLLLSGCAAMEIGTVPQPLATGDTVTISYTCQAPDGALVAASSDSTATVAGLTSSPIFTPQRFAHAPYTIPSQAGAVAVEQSMPMEEKIERYLLRQAIGKPAGETVVLTLDGEVFPGEGGDRYLPMRKNYSKKRRVTMAVDSFTSVYEVAPVVGLQKDTKVPDLSIRVLKVEGDKVEILYLAKPGMKMPSIFGEQSVTQTDEHLLMHTNAQEGALVRTSKSLIGKITEVTEDTFVVDYGHTFGFTPLTCQTVFHKAVPLPPPEQKPEEQAEQQAMEMPAGK